MFTQRNKWFSKKSSLNIIPMIAGMTLAVSQPVFAKDDVVRVYNWAGQIGSTTISEFQKETGIRVVYDVYDSNEVLEGKLMAGRSGFDVVSPSDSFLARQIQSDIYLPLDKSKLPNWKNLNPELMKLLSAHDPDNTYSIPYVWMTTGIGYNVDMIKARLGDDAPTDSWDLIFKPENLEKLKDCGVAFLDAPTEVFASVLNYIGKDPNSTSANDYTGPAYDLLAKLRPNIRYFHSSQYINDIANGDICVVLGWAGDVLQARDRAKEANNGVNVRYYIPKEGAIVFFDTFAIPKDSENVEAAHEFLNFIMRPDVAAEVTNDVNFASANLAANEFIRPDVLNDPAVYPTPAAMEKLFTLKVQEPRLERTITRTWTKVRTGK
ncbi:extracellular solute-binding protein [Zophobihabitans entericus]|uniref:Putrescine-binding periplasmic protein n=1 Tax=Zophobihabitans entericus TaxID=1635327 RepID=A0A6G9ICB0_9GAMM|nr:extracellular solute-binding protein [Zophobihabitans entericus]QIQ21220.1 extracellular solute-binding protein [Zophobihabitans entericus]